MKAESSKAKGLLFMTPVIWVELTANTKLRETCFVNWRQNLLKCANAKRTDYVVVPGADKCSKNLNQVIRM